jgi:hypothetical protein
MSSHRTRLATAALAFVATASLVTAAPADAGGTGDPERLVSIRGIEPREDRFFVKGKVRPSYENRHATIQRRVGRDGRWKAWEGFRTNERSRYRERIAPLRRPGKVFYRVKVDASGDFATSFSRNIWIRTYRL